MSAPDVAGFALESYDGTVTSSTAVQNSDICIWSFRKRSTLRGETRWFFLPTSVSKTRNFFRWSSSWKREACVALIRCQTAIRHVRRTDRKTVVYLWHRPAIYFLTLWYISYRPISSWQTFRRYSRFSGRKLLTKWTGECHHRSESCISARCQSSFTGLERGTV